MRTLCIDAPLQLSYGEMARPSPGPGEALVAISHIGYCGTDLNSYRGLNPLVTYPRVPGHEIAGVLKALGPGAPDGVRVGQRVTVLPYFNCKRCNACRMGRPNACKNNQTLGVQREGVLTEFACLPYEKIIPVDDLPLRTLALVEPIAVGFHGVRRADVAKGEKVVVLGAGVIGLGALIGAVEAGAEVLIVDLAERKLERARALGAAATVDASKENVAAAVARWAGEDGPQIVIEAVGAGETFTQAVDLVASCGRVVYVGYAKGKVAYETRFFLMKEMDIRGSRGSTIGDFHDVIAVLRRRPEIADIIVTRLASFDDALVAMTDWHADPGAFTKVMIEVNPHVES